MAESRQFWGATIRNCAAEVNAPRDWLSSFSLSLRSELAHGNADALHDRKVLGQTYTVAA
jgi:hypothetical protein